MMTKYISTVFLITTILSCNEVSKKTEQTLNEDGNQTHSVQDMPTNHINAWSDGGGLSFELHNDSIWALGDEFIKYERLNDSVFNIIYPKNPMVLEDIKIKIYENSRYMIFSNSGLSCRLDKNEIIFGADRLKFQKLSNNSVKVYYPQQSQWKISRVSNTEIYIFNEENKTKYREFLD